MDFVAQTEKEEDVWSRIERRTHRTSKALASKRVKSREGAGASNMCVGRARYIIVQANASTMAKKRFINYTGVSSLLINIAGRGPAGTLQTRFLSSIRAGINGRLCVSLS